MRDNRFGRAGTSALAAALVGWSVAGPRIPTPWRVPMHAAVATILLMVTGAPMGLRPPRLWSGLRLGSAVAAVAVAGVATTTLVPVVRQSMAGRAVPDSAPVWLLWQIPVGTVWAEEAAYRAALTSVAADTFGASKGRLLQAAAFGLSHIADARATGEPVLPTVLATGTAGWFFGWLANRSGSLLAPMLAHLAINASGAGAALILQRRLLSSSR